MPGVAALYLIRGELHTRVQWLMSTVWFQKKFLDRVLSSLLFMWLVVICHWGIGFLPMCWASCWCEYNYVVHTTCE